MGEGDFERQVAQVFENLNTVAIIELEQAGDSARAAVEADPGVSPATRDAVLEAHLAICIAKGKLDL